MIDSFWTKWRIRQLARGERLLVDKWLEDYARWLYGRLWCRCSGGHDRAQQLLEKIVVSAAGHLKEYTAPGPMSEWLLAIYEQLTADLPTVDKPPRPDSELRKAVGSLSSQTLSGAEPFWPQLTQLSQQAMAMLSCNEQRLLMCRYFHLERPANTAIQYDQSPSQIQTLLYKASHSFRRILEALAQAADGEVSQAGQSDSAILEVNLEKIIRTLVLETPTPEEMLQLKDRVIDILAQNKPKSWNDFHGKIPYLVGGASILCAAVFILIWLANSDYSVYKETNTAHDNKMQARQDVLSASVPDAAQQVQMAVRMGIAQDVDGLLNILRTGSYPAQVAAAYYLGRYGDKSAINLLDQVSQKWHAESSVEKNPFAEAITAIEDRMRQQMQNQLKMVQVSSKQSVPAGPDVASKVQTKPLAVESKQTPVEPNHTETPLVVHIEPNQPPVIEEVNPYPPESEPNHASPADDANEILPVDNADLYFYKHPNL